MSFLDYIDLANRPVNINAILVPHMTPEQLRWAISVVSEDYWNLSCWTCSDDGHSTFTFPYLQLLQRLFLAYNFYQFQIKNQLHMKLFMEQRTAARHRRLSR